MVAPVDHVALYAKHLGWTIRRKTIIVEGTTDVALFELAARLERESTGADLIASDLAIVAAGIGNDGGTRGVTRELIRLTGYARTMLDERGRPRYRFAALFDNDTPGRNAARGLGTFDSSLREFKDIFRLHPEMPSSGNLDPKALQRRFESLNAPYKGLNWELEDLLSEEFLLSFEEEFPTAVRARTAVGDKVHRELTDDGKAQLHRFSQKHCIKRDVEGVVKTLRALRFIMGLSSPSAG